MLLIVRLLSLFVKSVCYYCVCSFMGPLVSPAADKKAGFNGNENKTWWRCGDAFIVSVVLTSYFGLKCLRSVRSS